MLCGIEGNSLTMWTRFFIELVSDECSPSHQSALLLASSLALFVLLGPVPTELQRRLRSHTHIMFVEPSL